LAMASSDDISCCVIKSPSKYSVVGGEGVRNARQVVKEVALFFCLVSSMAILYVTVSDLLIYELVFSMEIIKPDDFQSERGRESAVSLNSLINVTSSTNLYCQ